ncbi:hypothetical protein Tco_1187973 [Tanacetum coccineum]
MDKDIKEFMFSKSKGKKVQRTKNPTATVIFKSPISVKGYMLGLANVQTWDSIVKKFGVRKSGSCADKEKGKRKVSQTDVS